MTRYYLHVTYAAVSRLIPSNIIYKIVSSMNFLNGPNSSLVVI